MRKDYACLGHKTLWLGGVGMKQDKCPECKRTFMRSPEHAYKRDGKFFCSYTCFRKEVHRKQEAEQNAESQELEAAKALVEKCLAKVRLYTDRVNQKPKGTKERLYAQELARRWRAKLDETRAYKQTVEEREKAKCTSR